MYEEVSVSEITEAELAAARTDWGNELIAISVAFDTEGIEAATEIANREFLSRAKCRVRSTHYQSPSSI